MQLNRLLGLLPSLISAGCRCLEWDFLTYLFIQRWL